MLEFIPLIVGIIALGAGAVLGYYARQSIAKRQLGTVDQKLQALINQAKQKANTILEAVKKEEDQSRRRNLKTEQFLLRKEDILNQKLEGYERRENDFQQKVKKLRDLKETLESLRKEALEKLERIAKLPKEQAKKELLSNCEKEFEQEILEKMRKLELEGKEKLQSRAQEILALAIQRCALSQVQEITTSTVLLPSDDLKGRIIGKEGRNIRTLEKLTGVEIVVDETPEAVLISGFDPIRRQIAKTALEKLIQDGRIQPARIEEIVQKTTETIASQIKEAGETAVYETGVIGLDPKLIQVLGRLKFRTSYGQNVLLHSIEVAYLAEGLAHELGADARVAKKAGLLHDIGKAMDHQVEGSHVDIGIRILEKFAVEKEVIQAMKSHHQDYPAENLEAILIQAADQVSGARPGARKDTVENYLRRLGELETIATSFSGVDKAYAIQAGREIRIFVKPEEIDDIGARRLAKQVAERIQEELRYPGEIKVNVIRESRVVEHAK